MRAGFVIELEDGTAHNIVCAIPDFLKWARHKGVKVEDITDGDLEDWLTVLHFAAIRQGVTTDDFDNFTARIVDLERQPDTTPKATRRAASKGS